MESKHLLTITEVANQCGVSGHTVGGWIREGNLRTLKTSNVEMISVDSLFSFLRMNGMLVMRDLRKQFRILVVDDEKSIASLISEGLKEACPDACIEQVHTGIEAGRQLSTLKPDAVILDINLPGVDGFELCTAIRSDPTIREAFIIAISGGKSIEVERRIMGCGANHFLGKPFDIYFLISVLAEHLSQKRERNQR